MDSTSATGLSNECAALGSLKHEDYEAMVAATEAAGAGALGDALPTSAFLVPLGPLSLGALPADQQFLVPLELGAQFQLPTLLLQQPLQMQMQMQMPLFLQQEDALPPAPTPLPPPPPPPQPTEVLIVQDSAQTLSDPLGPSAGLSALPTPGPSPTPTPGAFASSNKFRGVQLPTVLPRIAPAGPATPAGAQVKQCAPAVPSPAASPELPPRAPSTRRRLHTTANGASTRMRNESTQSQASCSSSSSSSSSGTRNSFSSSDSHTDDKEHGCSSDDGEDDDEYEEEDDDSNDPDMEPSRYKCAASRVRGGSGGERRRARRPRARKSGSSAGGRGMLAFSTEELMRAPWAEFTQRPMGTPRMRLKQWLLRLVSRGLIPGLAWRAGGEDYVDADSRTLHSFSTCQICDLSMQICPLFSSARGRAA